MPVGIGAAFDAPIPATNGEDAGLAVHAVGGGGAVALHRDDVGLSCDLGEHFGNALHTHFVRFGHTGEEGAVHFIIERDLRLPLRDAEDFHDIGARGQAGWNLRELCERYEEPLREHSAKAERAQTKIRWLSNHGAVFRTPKEGEPLVIGRHRVDLEEDPGIAHAELVFFDHALPSLDAGQLDGICIRDRLDGEDALDGGKFAFHGSGWF